MMGQGLALQSIRALLTGVLSQVVPGLAKLKKFFVVTFPVVIVPPGTMSAVGTLPGPKALLKATNDCQFTVS